MATMSRLKKPEAGASAEHAHADKAAKKVAIPKTWLVLQGDVIDEVVSETTPDTSVKKGERQKRVLCGTTDPVRLAKLRSFWNARARGVVGRGEAK